MKKKYPYLIVVLLLSGCSTSQEQVERLSAQARLSDSVPVCDQDSCQRKWDAAQSWVSQNSAYKIQTVSSAIIDTYSPANGDMGLAFNVAKEPISDGKYRIIIKAYCGNWIACSEPPLKAAQRFNDYVNNVK